MKRLPDRTVAMLEQRHWLLFHQCWRVFGRQRAAQIVLTVHRSSPCHS